MIYLTYYLALREEMWKIMRAEVGSVNIQPEDFVDALRQLPYLTAFIRVRPYYTVRAQVTDFATKGNYSRGSFCHQLHQEFVHAGGREVFR